MNPFPRGRGYRLGSHSPCPTRGQISQDRPSALVACAGLDPPSIKSQRHSSALAAEASLPQIPHNMAPKNLHYQAVPTMRLPLQNTARNTQLRGNQLVAHSLDLCRCLVCLIYSFHTHPPFLLVHHLTLCSASDGAFHRWHHLRT